MRELKKKVIVIEETPLGSNIFETIGEEYKQMDKGSISRRRANPKKIKRIVITNKWRERLEFCLYRGSNIWNIYLHGGMHFSHFYLTKNEVEMFMRLLSLRTGRPRNLEVQSIMRRFDCCRSTAYKIFRHNKSGRNGRKSQNSTT